MPPQKIHASKRQYKTDVSNLGYQSDTPLFRTRFSAALRFEDRRESVESWATKRRNNRELPFAGTPRTPMWNEKELLRSKEGVKDKKNQKKKTGWCADAAIEQERQLWGERGRNKDGKVYRMLGQSVEDQEGKLPAALERDNS
ncbi:hypothetical protein LTS08_006536 [Lithohypha guttulata]|nr:hypothetical protein LTS08_006536 [Lithohypha guttulata]